MATTEYEIYYGYLTIDKTIIPYRHIMMLQDDVLVLSNGLHVKIEDIDPSDLKSLRSNFSKFSNRKA